MMARLTAFTVSVESSTSRHRAVRLHAEQKVGSRETVFGRLLGGHGPCDDGGFAETLLAEVNAAEGSLV